MALLNISIALSRLPLKGQVSGYSGHCPCAGWQPSVDLTFEPRWFPSFHRQNHIYCRSQWPYWWGLNPRQGLVSTEAVTNWTAAHQWATATIWVRLFQVYIFTCQHTLCEHMWWHCLAPVQYTYHTSRPPFQTAADPSKPEKKNPSMNVFTAKDVKTFLCLSCPMLLLLSDGSMFYAALEGPSHTMSRTNGCLFCTWA